MSATVTGSTVAIASASNAVNATVSSSRSSARGARAVHTPATVRRRVALCVAGIAALSHPPRASHARDVSMRGCGVDGLFAESAS